MIVKTVREVRHELSTLLGVDNIVVSDDGLLPFFAHEQPVTCTLTVPDSTVEAVMSRLFYKTAQPNNSNEVALVSMLRQEISSASAAGSVVISMPVAIGVLMVHEFYKGECTEDEALQRLTTYGLVRDHRGGMLAITLSDHSDSYFRKVAEFVKQMMDNKGSDEPLGALCDELNDRRVHKLLPEGSVYPEAYADWKDVPMPHFWMMPDGSSLTKRGGKPVFRDLVFTGAVVAAAEVDLKAKVLVLGGESGSGKTCALLAAGLAHSQGKGLHIVVTRASLFGYVLNGQSEEEVAAKVRNYVYNKLERLLAITKGNDRADKVLDVFLHIDEAGMVPTLPKIQSHSGEKRDHPTEVLLSPTKNDALLRTLIKAAHNILRDEYCHNRARMRIYVALAGTGIDEMYKGGSGSIHGMVEVVVTQQFNSVVLHQLSRKYLARCYDPVATTEALMAQGVTAVVATNARLFRFTLERLAKVLEPLDPRSKFEDGGVPDGEITAAKQLVQNLRPNLRLAPQTQTGIDIIQQTHRNRGLLLPDVASLVVAFLPDACRRGALDFINANGLRDMPFLYREAMLRVAHAAHIMRAVLVTDEEWDELHSELVEAGFAPLRCHDGIFTAKLLVEGLSAGVWTSTKREGPRIESGHVRVSRTRDNGLMLTIPTSQPPVALSAAHRLLPRLMCGTLFVDTDWRSHESVTTEMVREGLDTLATVCGGCLRRELHCAVLGATYGLTPAATDAAASTSSSAAASTSSSAAAGSDNVAPQQQEQSHHEVAVSWSHTQPPERKRARHAPEQKTPATNTAVQSIPAEASVDSTVQVGIRHRMEQLDVADDTDAFRFDYGIKVHLSHALHLRPVREEAFANTEIRAGVLCACVAVDCAKALLKRLECERNVAERLKGLNMTCSSDVFDGMIKPLREAVEGVEEALANVGPFMGSKVSADENTKTLDEATAVLRPHIAHKMFVLMPPERSASVDAVLLCIGSATGRGYLGAMQLKALQKPSSLGIPLTFIELQKAGLPDVVRVLSDRWKIENKANESQIAVAVRQQLEALASCTKYPVKLSDFYFGINNTGCLSEKLQSALSVAAWNSNGLPSAYVTEVSGLKIYYYVCGALYPPSLPKGGEQTTEPAGAA